MTYTHLTTETISYHQIRDLRSEALDAGDYDQAAACDCDLALDGTIDMDDYTCVSDGFSRRLRKTTAEEALQICADAINAARAADDGGLS